MSKALKDPEVVAHVEKQVAKAHAAGVKHATKLVADASKAHIAGLEDKGAQNVAKAHAKAVTAALKPAKD